MDDEGIDGVGKVLLILMGMFFISLTLVFCSGIYFNHQYGMKKLELIEQGKIKAEVEKI